MSISSQKEILRLKKVDSILYNRLGLQRLTTSIQPRRVTFVFL